MGEPTAFQEHEDIWSGLGFSSYFLDTACLGGVPGHLQKTPLEIFSAIHHCFDIPITELQLMSLQCPRCHSPKIACFHQAMKIAAAIGGVGGVARGVSAALAGGQVGATVGAIAGPLGSPSAPCPVPSSAV